jgi:hypothetical protein
VSDPNELLERRLRQALDAKGDEKATRGLHLFCQIGGQYEELGMTTLQISSSGWTLLGWRSRDDKRTLRSVELQWADQAQLYRTILEYPFWEASPARRDREGEETNVHLRLSDRKKAIYSAVHFWDTEMQQFPHLKPLMKIVCDLIDGIGGGDIPFLIDDALEGHKEAARRYRSEQ